MKKDSPLLKGPPEGKETGELFRRSQAWINERTAPEILKYERVLVESLIELLEDQVILFVGFPEVGTRFA